MSVAAYPADTTSSSLAIHLSKAYAEKLQQDNEEKV